MLRERKELLEMTCAGDCDRCFYGDLILYSDCTSWEKGAVDYTCLHYIEGTCPYDYCEFKPAK